MFTLYVITCFDVIFSLLQTSLQLVQWFQVGTQWEAVLFLGMSSKELELFSVTSKMFLQKLCNLLQGSCFTFVLCVVFIIIFSIIFFIIFTFASRMKKQGSYGFWKALEVLEDMIGS